MFDSHKSDVLSLDFLLKSIIWWDSRGFSRWEKSFLVRHGVRWHQDRMRQIDGSLFMTLKRLAKFASFVR